MAKKQKAAAEDAARNIEEDAAEAAATGTDSSGAATPAGGDDPAGAGGKAPPDVSPFTDEEAAARLGVDGEKLAAIAARVAVPARCVFGFRDYGERLVVVTVDGRKLSDPPAAE